MYAVCVCVCVYMGEGGGNQKSPQANIHPTDDGLLRLFIRPEGSEMGEGAPDFRLMRNRAETGWAIEPPPHPVVIF